MSFHRENITWQGEDGTWNMAFFRVTWEGSEEDGLDPEWDVEYDYNEFDLHNYAYRQPTPDAAYEVATQRTSNPGGTLLLSRAINARECEKYDKMLEAARSADTLRQQDAIRAERWSAR